MTEIPKPHAQPEPAPPAPSRSRWAWRPQLRWFAAEIGRRPALELLVEPELSVVLFRRRGWTADDCWVWSATRAKEGLALVVPTTWHDEVVLRVCITNPRTTSDHLTTLLDDIERHPGAAADAGFS